MREVSNQILSVLVLVAMCVSLAGTFATFGIVRVGEVPEAPVTGLYSGITNVTVIRMGAIDVIVALVDFGNMMQGANNDTTDYDPHPFVINNNGTVFVNITICSEDLWPSAAPNPDKYYQFNASDDNSTDTALSTLQYGWVAPWTDMDTDGGPPPGCPLGVRNNLATCINNSPDAATINVHINRTVPTQAAAGSHTVTVTFMGADAGIGVCGAVT